MTRTLSRMTAKFLKLHSITRYALALMTTLALAGCIESAEPLFPLEDGAVGIPTGTFQLVANSDNTSTVTLARQGKLYTYSTTGHARPFIVSFHPIGDDFFIAMMVPFGTDFFVSGSEVRYGILDARSKARFAFVAFDCADVTPAELGVSTTADKTRESCTLKDRERLLNIANSYKSKILKTPGAVRNLNVYEPLN